VLPRGQSSVAWFSLAALLAILVLWNVGRWYARHRPAGRTAKVEAASVHPPLPPR
jgi:FSR family fosmidomycin resistance protein-like MFS transporter